MLKLACGPELVRLRVFPDAKELTEAFAASNAIRTHLWSRYKPNDERVCLIAVGDGNTPRSAALCAFLTRWQCVAVDPEMVLWRDWRRRHKIQDATWSSCEVKEGDEIDEEGDTHGWGGIRRLQVHRRKMQEMVVECELALIVMIHAHISLKDVLAAVKTKSGECAAVILPCCNWYSRLVPGRCDGAITSTRTTRSLPAADGASVFFAPVRRLGRRRRRALSGGCRVAQRLAGWNTFENLTK